MYVDHSFWLWDVGGMRLRQLEYFVAIAEHGSITSAASALFVAQPSLSTQLTALEKEIGGPLLDRLPRGVRLTPAGREFLIEARATLAAADRARRRTRSVLDATSGEFDLATVLSIAAGVLPPAISRWQVKAPAAQVRLHEYRHAIELETATAAGLHDLAVGPEPNQAFSDMVRIGREEFVVVLPRGDGALADSTVDVATLADRRWVLFGSRHGLSTVVRSICDANGVVPQGAVVTEQTDAAVQLAIAGIGPAIVPGNVVSEDLRRFCRPLREPYYRSLYAYSPAPFSSHARSFLAALSDSKVLDPDV
jgi:DNA-binding transcriptional LysR family regulator